LEETEKKRDRRTEDEIMKVAVVHMPTVFADVEENLRIAETYTADAAKAGAELIVFPEFFTTGFALNFELYEAIRKSGSVEERLRALSRDCGIAVGGSYLHYDPAARNAYNTFGLFFPTGEAYFHNKDIPTGLENFCYTDGDDVSAFHTPLGDIGVVMCWEQMRWRTVRRMAGKVDLLVGGSCWWGFTPEDGAQVCQMLGPCNRKLAEDAPANLARLMGVLFVHASHCGRFPGSSFSKERTACVRGIESRTTVVDAAGNCLFLDDGHPGCFTAEVQPGCTAGALCIPKEKTWIPELPPLMLQGFEILNEQCRAIYAASNAKHLMG
jgi:hypothetical protein